MQEFFDLSTQTQKAADAALAVCAPQFAKITEITRYNQQKMLRAFIDHGVSEACLGGSTGYGYGDRGRETLEKICASVFGAEDSLIRHNFTSGTHTLTVALFGILRPGDTMLCVTGRPYDTLIGVLGIEGETDGSLKDFGVGYEQVDLLPDGSVDIQAVQQRLKEKKYKMVYIQRSRGYSLRPTLTIEKIEEICKAVRAVTPDPIIMVDNCYGEFTEKREPCAVGADLIAGSLIKNPGGGIAPTGGYIAGRADLVEKCAYRLTAPGVGREIGATLGLGREMFMGFYNAPHVTGEALKTAVFAAALFEQMGYTVTPRYNEKRGDIIQAICLNNSQCLIAFCKGIQAGAPVDSYVVPEPWEMPGYDSKVIMAAGAFTGGSSIELSADAPLREPYAVWMQGGLHFDSAMVGVLLAAEQVSKIKD
ncbi:MAG: methionine gamma-lyase family protein [Clostridia bacterium]|nr:methionine gamma-lyase family protein [Clostridia bacterium]